MDTELIDQVDPVAPSAKQEWLEPQIMIERPLEARADDDQLYPFPTPIPRHRVGPLSTSGATSGSCK